MLEKINDRIKLLNQELQNAKNKVSVLTVDLEQAKTHLNVVSGHFNEASFLLNEIKKESLSKVEQEDSDADEMAPENQLITPDEC